MAKLGKRARKFAKKHLRSVLKRRRSLKSMFKRKRLAWNKQVDGHEDKVQDEVKHPNERSFESDDKIPSLASVFGGDDCEAGEITSDQCQDLGSLHFAETAEGDRNEWKNRCCSLTRSDRMPTEADVVTWKHSAMENTDTVALTNLLIIYQHACCCRGGSAHGRQDLYASVTVFLLRNADTIFRRSLEPGSETRKPLIHAYLQSTVALIGRLSDPDTLEFSLIRVQQSIRFFAPFPDLREKLVRVSTEAWSATGTRRSLCLCAFDAASVFGFPSGLCGRYLALTRHRDASHVALMRDCIVSADASSAALPSALTRLQKILNHGRSKEMVCSPEYVACVDLCVRIVEARPRFSPAASASLVRTVHGTVRLFPGPRYVPLRAVCVRWLNRISAAAALFVPVASVVLDMLEFGTCGPAASPGPVLKLPKKGLMSLDAVVRLVVALLSSHFSLWFRHVSFPDLVVVPLAKLKRFCSSALAGETSRRLVKRFVDRVEMNAELVRRKREEIAFSLAAPFVGDCAACVSLLDFYAGLAGKEL